MRVNAIDANSHVSAGSKLVLPGVVACFFLSGFAALLYQTAWLRQFSFVFGTSELAVAAVLAAYMGGLAAGSAVAARLVGRVGRPILVYGALEAGIAVSALAVPLLLTLARLFYASLLGNQPAPPDAATIGQPVFYLIVGFVVLALPTGFMGATLPLLTRYAVTADREIGPRVALLYATNTAGAVFGTATAGFALLPALGLNGTVWCGVAVNMLVFGLAALLARRAPAQTPGPSAVPGRTRHFSFLASCISPLFRRGPFPPRLAAVFRGQPVWIKPIILISGANAFLYEVLWTRMLTHVLGGSIYAFATMLAAFLTGIALGGGLAGRFAAKRNSAAVAFGVTQVLIGALSVGVYAWMGPLIPEGHSAATQAGYAFAVMLPATIFIGATFPLAVRILALDESEAAVATATVYAWNTVGAIVGAIFAAFFIIPALGFEGAIKWAVVVNLALAVWTFSFIAVPGVAPAGAAAAALLLSLVVYHPARPQAVISSSGFEVISSPSRRELFYAVGRSSTVLLLDEGKYYNLRTNGLPEASVQPKGALPSQDAEKWLTALPVVARSDTQSMLVVGFGGGVSLEGVPPTVRQVDVIEIEPEVIRANRVLAERRNHDPLSDPRINVVINDARNALRLTDKRYDVIVSQPSHPWTAGASHLFTSEFVAEARSHLSKDGVFVQWMSSDFVTMPLLRSLAATLLANFESVRLYQPSSKSLTFLASDGPLDTEIALARSGRPLRDAVMHYSRMGLNGVEDLLVALVMDQAGIDAFATGAPISTDDHNLMATSSRARADGLEISDLLELFAAYSPLEHPESWVFTDLPPGVSFSYVARRLMHLEQKSRVERVAQAVPDDSERLLMEGLLLRLQGSMDQARIAWTQALSLDPGNMQARYCILEPYLVPLARGAAAEDLVGIAAGLGGSAGSVVAAWKFFLNRDWVRLAGMDGWLGVSRITDAWYPEAARLRAEWRANIAPSMDAIDFIDRAVLLEPSANLLLLRVMNAWTLGELDMFVESSRQFAIDIRRNIQATAGVNPVIAPERLLQMRQNLAAIARRLEGGVATPFPERSRDVLEEVNGLIRLIDRQAADGADPGS